MTEENETTKEVTAFGRVNFYALTSRMDVRFQQLIVIKFWEKECASAADISLRLQAVCEESCLSRTQVFEWLKRIKGRDSLDDDARPGRPVAASDEQTVARVEAIVYTSTE